MTNDKLLAEGEAYADLVGYQGSDKEIASVAYMRGIEKTTEKACKFLCKICSESSGHLKDGESCSFIREFTQAMKG